MIKIRRRTDAELTALVEEKRLELSRAVMSPHALSCPVQNAKKVLRLAAELLELASAYEAGDQLYAQLSVAWEVTKTA